MPYLTPDEIPEDDTCRPLFIPQGSEWLAIVSGALTELTKPWNWEQFGAVTVQEAVDRSQEIVDGYYAEICGSCELPGGGAIFRINPVTWEVEQLVEGEWTEPQGEYELPPTPAREEPTTEERRCLASANAVNALEELYEQLSDSFGEGQSQSEAAADFAVKVIAVIGLAFGVVVSPLIALFAAIFSVVYDTVEYVTADLWTEGFTEELTCMFYECSLDEGDVIHFDIQCIIDKIGAATEIEWTFSEVRLLLQIAYMLNILGSQAIDAAGATTAITEADCEGCDDDWCFTFDLTEVDADGVAYTENGCTAVWADDIGWYATFGGGCAGAGGVSVLAAINISFASSYIRKVVVVGTCFDRTNGTACAVAFPAINRGGTPSVTCVNIENGEPLGTELIVEGMLTGITAEFQNAASGGGEPSSGTAVIRQVTFYGSGECPFGIPNCIG